MIANTTTARAELVASLRDLSAEYQKMADDTKTGASRAWIGSFGALRIATAFAQAAHALESDAEQRATEIVKHAHPLT